MEELKEEKLREEILKEFDFDYLYQLNRVKRAELEVADFEECGEELKQKISHSLTRIAEASAREAREEERAIWLKTSQVLIDNNNKGTPICENCGKKTIKWFDHQVFTGFHCSNCGKFLPLQDNK